MLQSSSLRDPAGFVCRRVFGKPTCSGVSQGAQSRASGQRLLTCACTWRVALFKINRSKDEEEQSPRQVAYVAPGTAVCVFILKSNQITSSRWLEYSSVGKRLDGTRFIAFKVPLKQALTRQLPSSEVFGHWELLDSLKQQNQDLGLIVDLTNTGHYYSLQDVPESLAVAKIMTAGHRVPGDDVILSFKRIVHKFLRENGDNDRLIGVHCTHGLNRTGYLICRYLVDVDGLDPEEAIQLFNSSRGHDMERQNYVMDLCLGPRRSNERMDEPEREPQRGEARQRPAEIRTERDQGGPPPHTWNHRPTLHRHHDDHGPSSSLLRTHPPTHTNPRNPPQHKWMRYPSQAEGRYRPPFQEQGRYRPPSQAEGRHRPPSQAEGRYRPPPPQPGWIPACATQQCRRRPPPRTLPRYTPRWPSGCDGGDEN